MGEGPWAPGQKLINSLARLDALLGIQGAAVLYFPAYVYHRTFFQPGVSGGVPDGPNMVKNSPRSTFRLSFFTTSDSPS